MCRQRGERKSIMLQFDLTPELMGAIGQELNAGRKIAAVGVIRCQTEEYQLRPCVKTSIDIVKAIESGAWHYVYLGGDSEVIRYRVTV